jgi:hypothetical protein
MIFIECTNLNLVNVNVKEDLSAEVKVPNIVVVLIVANRHATKETAKSRPFSYAPLVLNLKKEGIDLTADLQVMLSRKKLALIIFKGSSSGYGILGIEWVT